MGPPRAIKTLEISPGSTMSIMIDDNLPETSIDKYFTEVITVAGEDSEPVNVPLHWHKRHGEHFDIIEGRVELTLDGKTRTVTAGDATVYIPPRAVHGFKGFKGERLVARERADPAGQYKVLFFNDILSTGKFGDSLPHVLRAFYDGDCYMALPFGIRWIDEVFLAVCGTLARPFAPAKPKTLE